MFPIVAYCPPCYKYACRVCFLSTAMHVNAAGTACLLCALTSGGLQRVWALAGRFGAASAVGLAQPYLAELLSSDVQHAALAAAAQVCPCFMYHSFHPLFHHPAPSLTVCHASPSAFYGFEIQLNTLQLSLPAFLCYIPPSPFLCLTLLMVCA